MSRDNLVRLRAEAFHRQQGRCYYCGVPMWNDDGAKFAAMHHLSNAVARRLRCTAEHLRPCSDGGTDHAGNIAAACWHCNVNRHRRKVIPQPERFRIFVRNRLLRRKWHDAQVHKARVLH